MKKTKFLPYEPKRCWVGEASKVCYEAKEDAELMAGALEYQHPGIKLKAYKCAHGDHWHLANSSPHRY